MSNILLLVLARNGSKGIKNKNVHPICGKPLIQYTLEFLKASPLGGEAVVSTDGDPIRSASLDIADLVIDRPAEMATDMAGRSAALLHALKQAETHFDKKYDFIFDFLCTAPIREQEDLSKCYELLQSPEATNVLTAVPARRNPYFNMLERDTDGHICISKDIGFIANRQEAPQVYDMNGSIYGWTRDCFLAGPAILNDRTQLHVMDEKTAIDVDTPMELKLLELFMAENN